jgi:hypothetical protein
MDTIYAIDVVGTIYRNGTSIATGASTTTGTFSLAFDNVLICSGDIRLKDNGTNVFNLGIGPATAPVITTPVHYVGASLQNTALAAGADGGATFSQSGGQLLFNGAQSYDGVTTFGTIALQVFDTAGYTDMSVLSVPTTTLTAPIELDDIITFTISATGATAGLGNIRAVVLAMKDSSGIIIERIWQSIVGGYGDATTVNFLGLSTITISTDRNNLMAGLPFDWTSVGVMQIIIVNTGPPVNNEYNIKVDDHFTGGPWEDTNLVANNIEYMQVNIRNDGSYVGRSEEGPSTGFLYTNGFVFSILPQVPSDPQVTGIQVFRRGNTVADWRLVLTFDSTNWTVAQIDGMTDAIALEQTGFDLTLVSTDSIEEILQIVGPFEGRWYYFTSHFCYPSDIIDPDLVNGASEVVKLTGGNSENFLWAQPVDSETILIGTNYNIYVLRGTFITQPDGTIDIFYSPLNVKYPPVNEASAYYQGNVYYLGSDGWRSINTGGTNTNYVIPSLERLYQGETCAGYVPVTFALSPLVISNNKLWGCTNSGIHVYDFVRQYWHNEYPGSVVTSAVTSLAGNPLVAIGNSVCELNRRDSTPSITCTLTSVNYDCGLPLQRKDLYTLRVRCSGSGTVLVYVQYDETGLTLEDTITLTSNSQEFHVDLMDPLLISGTPCKLFQISFVFNGTSFTLDWFTLDYDPHPIPVTWLRIQETNYGSYGYKRLFTQPFELDTLGGNVNIYPIVDGTSGTPKTVNSSRKTTVGYEFDLASGGAGTDVSQGIDYSWIIHGNEFEFYGMPQPKNIEVFPDLRVSHVIPSWNGGNALKKRLRVWPVTLNSRNADIFWTPIVDGVAKTELQFEVPTTSGLKRTVLLQYPEDIIGVDFSAYMRDSSGSQLWEFWEALSPEIVETYPIARRFDQIGPIDVPRFGKMVKFDLRLIVFGTSVPWKIYTQDSEIFQGVISTLNGKAANYEVNVPKGCNGKVFRMELGPVSFDMHRYYARFLVQTSGTDTDKGWITFPNESQ